MDNMKLQTLKKAKKINQDRVRVSKTEYGYKKLKKTQKLDKLA